MRVHRGYLFWGIVLLLLGAIPLADRQGWIDLSSSGDLWRLWPLTIIAVGLAILLSRTRAASAGTVAAAVVIGAVGGSALAYGGGFIGAVGDCTADRGTMQHMTSDGTFTSDARVSLDFKCGTLDVTAMPGRDWSVDAGYQGAAPTIDDSNGDLAVRAPDAADRRQEWDLNLPSDALRALDVQANAGTARIDVGSSELDELRVEANAGEVRLSADGSLADLQVSVNAGSAQLTLDGPAAGLLSVNAGSIEVCVPDDAALELVVAEQFAFGNNLSGSGLTRDGNTWRRSGDGPDISLRVEGNAASFNLNPSGGCDD
jgi:hypothetical protein